ncbi:hypothetical protein [Paludibaculum fermentans]|uniref:Uncharacterized protein n=1 Tax=Paludibaculum fermentans TaxID=1473598 RepID=A0A7S7SMS8_PALFE|nr:hypothetical protein [Paludibaculum fermentans]QOY90263.1 hypothetical protein IRI77_10000 [Paludibaculum fermentans]
MNDYGVFANLATVAASLASAAAAVRLAFMKRSKWQPPEEAVPAAVSRFAALLAMVVIALLYVFGRKVGQIALATITITLFVIAVACLIIALRTNVKYSFYYPKRNHEPDRKLGGDVLTDEAARIRKQKSLSEQQLFEDAQGDKDLVWTKASQASVMTRSTLSFIGLVGLGTCTLAAAAMLVVISMAE